MPNIASAKKRMRSDARKKLRNQMALSELKTLDRKLVQSAGNPQEADLIAKRAISRYDRAVSKGIIPRGRADRKKSRIQNFLRKLKK
ncbi:MAG: 30S ribosomal protein S20 [Omnitrophica bacterium GWA2_52_8]|nr:MAG: 30S ribosomal protein S20 [Omnitrophica bacterium GWA2_52_8]